MKRQHKTRNSVLLPTQNAFFYIYLLCIIIMFKSWTEPCLPLGDLRSRGASKLPSCWFSWLGPRQASSCINPNWSCRNSWSKSQGSLVGILGRCAWSLATCRHSATRWVLGCRGTGRSWRFDQFMNRHWTWLFFRPFLRRCIQQPRYRLRDCTVFGLVRLLVLDTRVSKFSEWGFWLECRRPLRVQNLLFSSYHAYQWADFEVWGLCVWFSSNGSSWAHWWSETWKV